MRLRLHVQHASTDTGVPGKVMFARWARAALRGFGRGDVELGIRIVDEKESAELNERYRHKTGPTNVLSFPFENPPGVESGLLGDLVICAPLVAHEAQAQHKEVASHWAHMIVHGIMHLRGMDHENEQDALVMESREKQILQTLGFFDPYL